MPTYTDADTWAAGFLDDAEKVADVRLLDFAEDAAQLFVGSVPRHGELPGRMVGVHWGTRRDTGRARDSIRVKKGDASDFPAPELAAYPATGAMVARSSGAIAANRWPVLSIGTSSVPYYEFIEDKYRGFERAVLTLFQRIDAS